MWFWGHNFGSRRARRSVNANFSNGTRHHDTTQLSGTAMPKSVSTPITINADDHLFSKKMAYGIDVQGQSKSVKNSKTPHFVTSSQENPSSKSKKFFNRI